MGQKVNPIGMRIGISRDWNSKWYASNKDFATFLGQDIKIRKFLETSLKDCLVSHIEIERVQNGGVTVSIFTSRPGMILGQDAANIKTLTKKVQRLVGVKDIKLSVVEVKNPDLDAAIVAHKWQKHLKNVHHSVMFKKQLSVKL